MAALLRQTLVGADPRVCPEFAVFILSKEGRHMGLPLPVCLSNIEIRGKIKTGENQN